MPFDCTFTYESFSKLSKWMGLDKTEEILPGSPSLNVKPPVNFLQELGVDLYYVGLNSWKDEPVFEYGMDTYGISGEWVTERPKVNRIWNTPMSIHPLNNANLVDLERYPWPDPCAPELAEGLGEKAKSLFEKTDFALVGKFSSSIFEQAAALRGMERLYMDFALEPEFVDQLISSAGGYRRRLDRYRFERLRAIYPDPAAGRR